MRPVLLYRFLLAFLMMFSLVAAAAEPACFAGQWQFDAGDSDNPQRLLDKLQRKQKMQEHARARPAVGRNDNELDLSLPDTIPAFVFWVDDLQISQDGLQVLLRQQQSRRLSTDGSARPLSLSALQQQGDVTVAGWEQGQLVIETTTISGVRVDEIISLADADLLRQVITVWDGLAEKPVILEKFYRRDPALPSACAYSKP